MNKFKLFLGFFSILIFINLSNASLFVNNFNYNISNGNLNYKLTVANSEDKVISDVLFKFTLVNTNSKNIVLKEDSFIDSYYNYEAKIYNKKINISNIPNGKYTLNFIMYQKTGAPINGFKKDINLTLNNFTFNYINNISTLIDNGPYLINENKNGDLIGSSHGMLGENLKGKENIFVGVLFKKNLSNGIKNNLKLKVKLFYSYSQFDKPTYSTQGNLTYFNNLGKLKLNYSKPGSYNVKVSFLYKNQFLFSKIIRLVIYGKSGGIVDVLNSQDIYKKGDIFNLNGILIGPADGASQIENPHIKMSLIQNNKQLYSNDKKLENLGFQPLNFNFKINNLSFDLNNYQVKLDLYDTNLLLDEVILNYTKLSPKYLYKNGLVYKNDPNMCLDDGICTKNEKNIGNCLDCHLKELNLNKNTKENNINKSKIKLDSNDYSDVNYFYLVLISFLILLIIIIPILIYNKIKGGLN